MIKHCSCCGWWKRTSQDKAILISEEIKSAAQAILELCLSENISKQVNQSVENPLNQNFKNFIAI